MRKWKYLRMFVSSTFLDMDYERDILKTIVEPKLNEYLKDYAVSFEFIDLRHSVKTDISESLKERENKIFNICLDEIDSCRPLFLGMLGHRYGWIPAEDGINLPSVELPEGFPVGKDKLSVTMCEFIHGVFSPDISAQRSIILLRNISSYQYLPIGERKVFLEDEDKIGPIREYFNSRKEIYNVIDYTIDLSSEDSTVRLNWAEMVTSQIIDLIKEEIETIEISELDEFILRQENYVQHHIRNFEGRESELKEIWELLEDPTCEIILTAQQEGVGLSSLFCKVYEKLREDSDNICLIHCNDDGSQYVQDEVLYFWLKILDGYLDRSNATLIEAARHDTGFLSDIWKDLTSKLEEQGYQIYVLCEDYRFNETFAGLSVGTIFTISTTYYSAEQSFLEEWMYFIEPFDEASRRAILQDIRPEVALQLENKESSVYANWLSLAISIVNNLTKLDFSEIRNRTEQDHETRIIKHQIELAKALPDGYENIVGFLLERIKTTFSSELIDNYLFLLSLNPAGWEESILSQILGCNLLELGTMRQLLGDKIIRKNPDGLWQLSDIEITRLLTQNFELKDFKGIISKAYSIISQLPQNDSAYITMIFKLAMLGGDVDFCVRFVSDSLHNDDCDEHAIDALAWFAVSHKLDYMGFFLKMLAVKKDNQFDFYNNFLFWIEGFNRKKLVDEYVISINRYISHLRTAWVHRTIDLPTYSIAAKALAYFTEFYGQRDYYDKWTECFTLGLGITREFSKENTDFLTQYLCFLRHKFLSLKNKSDLEDEEIFNWLNEYVIKPELRNEFQFATADDVSAYASLLFDVTEFLSNSGFDEDADSLCLKSFNLYLRMIQLSHEGLPGGHIEPKQQRLNLMARLMSAQKLHFHNGLLRNDDLKEISEKVFEVCEVSASDVQNYSEYGLYHRTMAAYWFLLDIPDEEKFVKLMDLADNLIKQRDSYIFHKNMFYLKESASRFVDGTYNAWLYTMALAMYILCDKPGGMLRYEDKLGRFKSMEQSFGNLIEFSSTLMMIKMSLNLKKTFQGGLLPSPQLWDSLLILWQAVIFHELKQNTIDIQTILALYNSIGDIVEAMRENSILYPMAQFKQNLRDIMNFINETPEEEASTLDTEAKYF